MKTTIDFSQFTPRGHYTCLSEYEFNYSDLDDPCTMANYFKCMMWLGRADCAFVLDSLRHLRSFTLIHECMERSGVLDQLARINQTISLLVGDIDAFSFEGMSKIMSTTPLSIESIVHTTEGADDLRARIAATGGGNQLILSQAIWKDPDAARPEPPKIGQICGQRFILDSYLLGRTVEGYVKTRNVPFLEEVAFCLGNNAATEVVSEDITTYTHSALPAYKPYHTRLGAARTLFEEYPYWEQNCYTLWLDALRKLSEPLPSTTPLIMRSHAWQDKQMNTQLASWAQLRRNTLLYAKQSYTAGVMCFYPDGYVEPYPEFYRAIGKVIERLASVVELFPDINAAQLFNPLKWLEVTGKLAAMAERELEGDSLTEEDLAFLNEMLVVNEDRICGDAPFFGWYPSLFASWDKCAGAEPCIADVHTIPPGIYDPSDMVLHAATGDASYIIIQAASGNDCGSLFVGAVSSFYQHNEQPINRLADGDWTSILHGTVKPSAPQWFSRYMQ